MLDKDRKNDEKIIIQYKKEENIKTFQEVMQYCFNWFIIKEKFNINSSKLKDLKKQDK